MQTALISSTRDQANDVRRYNSGAKDERRKTTKKSKANQGGINPINCYEETNNL